MLKIWYQFEHDGIIRWAWMDYIKLRDCLTRNWMLFHPESYFEYV